MRRDNELAAKPRLRPRARRLRRRRWAVQLIGIRFESNALFPIRAAAKEYQAILCVP